MDTAGRAVLFAGVTVIVTLLGMLVLGVGFLAGLGISSAIAVLMTMLAALTLLPALLSRFGARIVTRPGSRTGIRRRPRATAAPATAAPAAPDGFWGRWGELIRRHLWPAALVGLAIMLAVASPALSMRLGVSDASNDPASTTTHSAYTLLADSFGKGFNGPLVVVARLPRANDKAALKQIRTTLAGTAGVASVSPTRLSGDGRTAVYEVFPRSTPQAAATTTLVKALRARILPPTARATAGQMRAPAFDEA